MRQVGIRWLLAMVLTAALVGFGAACGGDDEGDEGGEEPTATLEVEMDEFKFIPKNAKTPAGTDQILAPNIGQITHELELFKSDKNPGSLKVSGGRADTAPLGEEVTELVADPGETAEVTVDPLEPGKYAMICNIPGHYQKGMWGSLTVK